MDSKTYVSIELIFRLSCVLLPVLYLSRIDARNFVDELRRSDSGYVQKVFVLHVFFVFKRSIFFFFIFFFYFILNQNNQIFISINIIKWYEI